MKHNWKKVKKISSNKMMREKFDEALSFAYSIAVFEWSH